MSPDDEIDATSSAIERVMRANSAVLVGAVWDRFVRAGWAANSETDPGETVLTELGVKRLQEAGIALRELGYLSPEGTPEDDADPFELIMIFQQLMFQTCADPPPEKA
jgi:hypothetical protein